MNIPKELVKKWRLIRSHGDADKMTKKLPGSYPELFNRALRGGKCSDEVFKVLAEFYDKKETMIKEYL